MSLEHPFAMQLGELEEALRSSSAASREQAQAAEEQEGCVCESPTEEDATTERMGEEGGIQPDELPDATTLALGEEGGELPPDFPEPTGILAEQGGVVSDPLPLATTEAVGEEGGDFDFTTDAIGEEGGVITRADGEDGDSVFTFIEGEDGEIRDLDKPMEPTTLAVGEEGGDGDVQIAEVETLAGTPDEGNLEVITDAFGEPGGFEADVYGELYPALIDAVNSGVVPSLLDHYEAFGQFEPERIGIFDGNFESPDIVTAFGNNTVISGVPIIGYDPIVGDFIFGGNGEGEKDVLIGQSNPNAKELFILGDNKVRPYSFYATLGNDDLDDYAVIQNFDVGSDQIQLSGFVTDYNFEVVNNSTYISKVTDGDLVAIVENVSNIQDATLMFEGY